MKNTSQFPIVDALLQEPSEGSKGSIAICTNTVSTGQVFNEIDESIRENICTLGNVVVSRDGTERMILNSLVHPTLKFLVLFSEESLTFSPNTNLLLAAMNGMEDTGEKNIIGGIAASSHYPNISADILGKFNDNIIVLPLHMHRHADSNQIVENYLDWLVERGVVTDKLIDIMRKVNKKGKAYYDVLNKFLAELSEIETKPKDTIELNPEDFQHLQPPKVSVDSEYVPLEVPFEVVVNNKEIDVRVRIKDKVFGIAGGNSDWDTIVSLVEGLLEYSTNSKHKAGLTVSTNAGLCGPGGGTEEDNCDYDLTKVLKPEEQILLGVEIGRAHTDVMNGTKTESFVVATTNLEVTHRLELVAPNSLEVDDEFYYKFGLKDGQISAMAMALDVCEPVYDLRSESGLAIALKIAEMGRFKDYKYGILHRLDVGTQIARVHIAYINDFLFIQDFAAIFKVNTTDMPFIVAESDTFLDVHKQLLQKLYTQGVEEEHADARKGMARTGICLAIYRDSEEALRHMTAIYKQGEHTTDEMREAYKDQLLREDHDGAYSYGQRTRTHFGFDQLEKIKECLKTNPTKTAITTRYDPIVDMSYKVSPDTGMNVFTHDPCLVNDIYFIRDGKLHSFHIARAHNTVNAYPENIFGLFDAYVTPIKEDLRVEGGDFFMLSNRANILILTEDQRTKKLMSEPSKPNSYEYKAESGPVLLNDISKVEPKAVNYKILKTVKKGNPNKYIKILENYDGQGAPEGGVDIIAKAIGYLNLKGLSHNNPVIQTYRPGIDDPQSDQLAFYQANVFAGKVYSTAVFTNCEDPVKAEEAANYIAKRHENELKCPHGELYIFYL